MALKRKTGDGLVVNGGQELQPLPKTSEESEAKKLRVNPPRKARMAPVAETPMSEPVLPKKTRASRKKKVADPPQAGPSQPTALAAKKQRKTAEEVETSVDLEDGWLDKFLTMTTDDLARPLGEIANHGKVKRPLQSRRPEPDSQVRNGGHSRKPLAFLLRSIIPIKNE